VFLQADRSSAQPFQHCCQRCRIGPAFKTYRGFDQPDFDYAVTALIAHTRVRRRQWRQCHRDQPWLIEQACAQLAPPFEHHIRIQIMLQGQLCDRHSWFACLLRQLPLELQRVVRAASAPAVFNFILQDSPHQI
jgi:hypothetical protein